MTHRTVRALGALVGAALLGACASEPYVPIDFASAAVPVAEESAPLSGAALAQRRIELARAYRDLEHFHDTLESLDARGDHKAEAQLQRFADGYLGLHVSPLLIHQWQSRHPELAGLDANLRFAHADVLMRMRDTSRAQHVIDDIATRYAGREQMLVEYPFGAQNPLGTALQALRTNKWSR